MAVMNEPSLHQQLRQPDEFVGFFGGLLQWVNRNLRSVLIGTVVVLVAIGSGVAFRYWKQGKNAAAADELNEILKAYPSVYAAKGFPASSWDDLLKKLESFQSAHGGASLSSVAGLYRGHILMTLGRYDDAATQYGAVASRLDAPYDAIAREGVARALVELKKWDEAEKAWKSLADEKDNPLAADHLWNLALTQESKGAKADALATYQRFETKFPSAPQIEKVRQKTAALKTTP